MAIAVVCCAAMTIIGLHEAHGLCVNELRIIQRVVLLQQVGNVSDHVVHAHQRPQSGMLAKGWKERLRAEMNQRATETPRLVQQLRVSHHHHILS